MDQLELFFWKLGLKFKRIPLIIKILVPVVAIALVGVVALYSSDFFETIGMSAEEKEQYRAEQQAVKEQEEEQQRLAELIAQEEANGYKVFNSPNLTDSEKQVIEFVNACNSNDYETVAYYLDVPNTFTDDNFDEWIDASGMAPFVSEVGELRNIAMLKRDVYGSSKKEVIGQEDVAVIWRGSDTSNKIVLPYEIHNEKVSITPDTGMLVNQKYLIPSQNAHFGTTDISSYAGKTVTTRTSTWYEYVFPKMADIGPDGFPITIDTPFGSFVGIIAPELEYETDYERTVIADFTKDEIETINQYVASAIQQTIQLVQQRASDEEIANYMAIGDILEDIAPSQHDVGDIELVELDAVTDVTVARNETVQNGYVLNYNYHLNADNSVTCKVNIRYGLNTGGECRRSANVTIRPIGNTWCIIGQSMLNNSRYSIFTNINMLDPEW